VECGLQIDHIRKKNFRKESHIRKMLAERGDQPGLVWIFSAMEPCATYKPWHNKETGNTYLVPDDGKCLHYYFYFNFIDPDLGLGYVRVPTWLPCRLQVYFNGHNWLAAQLKNVRSHIRCWTTPSATSRTGRRRNGLRMDGKRSGSTGSWTHGPNDSAPLFGISGWLITGAWINANTPRTWCSGGKRISRRSTQTSPARPSTP
jgi:hypothetical protein